VPAITFRKVLLSGIEGREISTWSNL